MKDDASHPLSPIRVFAGFEKQIAKINAYPLSSDNIVVQRDAYSRLVDYDMEELDTEAYDDPFAVLEHSKKEHDEGMRFMFEFNAVGVYIYIETLDPLFVEYDVFVSVSDAARQLAEMGIMLANGQLSVLHTTLRGKWCATEIILRDRQARKPITLFAEAKYPRLRSGKAAEADYDCHLLRNTFAIDTVRYDRDFFLVPKKSGEDAFLKLGRALDTGEITPLTKEKHEAFFETLTNDLEVLSETETPIGVLAYSWEYWTVFTISFVPVIAIFLIWDVPNRFYYLLPLFGLAAALIGMVAAFLSRIKRAVAKEYEVDVFVLKVDRLLARLSQKLGIKRLATSTKSERIKALNSQLQRLKNLTLLSMIVSAFCMSLAAVQARSELAAYGVGVVPFWVVLTLVAAGHLIAAQLLLAGRLQPGTTNYLAYGYIILVCMAAFVSFGNLLFPGGASLWLPIIVGLFSYSAVTDFYNARDMEVKDLQNSKGSRKLQDLFEHH